MLTASIYRDKLLTELILVLIFQGNVTFSCSDSQPVSVTFLNSTASYLALPADTGTEGLSVRLQLRTWNRDGRLFSVPLTRGPSPASLVLQLSGGSLWLSLRRPPQRTIQVFTGERINHSPTDIPLDTQVSFISANCFKCMVG